MPGKFCISGEILRSRFLMKTSELTRRRFLRLGGLGAAGLTVVAASTGLMRTKQVDVEQLEIELARLPK